jgi:hypothetical protein
MDLFAVTGPEYLGVLDVWQEEENGPCRRMNRARIVASLF